ncbi:hypothetical protein ACFYO2_24000 [Streptomyces sp. NPDC006602]|uniref:hypothetical protein n=1 Tax=Streptomyces sp. NPDC006602 TaxID=3364751 RepID=UPI0036C433E5
MRAKSRRSRVFSAGTTAALGFGPLTGRSSGTGPGRQDGEITVSSQESPPYRVAATQKIVDGSEHETGIKVRLVGVAGPGCRTHHVGGGHRHAPRTRAERWGHS